MTAGEIGTTDFSLEEVLHIHFDTKWGTPYWLERRAGLSFDPGRDVRSVEDLSLFGPFPTEELRKGPVDRFLPKRFQDEKKDLILSETGGTTGPGMRVYFSRREYRQGFIDPFLQVARRVNWPEEGRWLYLGPSGPHIIGSVLGPICRELGSPPPFRIDFDPRWSLRLTEGSVARARYLEHLVDQALHVMDSENVEILFGTPAVLERLAERLGPSRCESIRAVHYGGTALTQDSYRRFREELFPNAVHLSGYGNSLVGVAFEAGTRDDERLCYYPAAQRHLIRLVPYGHGSGECPLDLEAEPGQMGRVVVSRLDKTCFLPNLIERDTAAGTGESKAALSLGWTSRGIREPRPIQEAITRTAGFY